MLVVLRVKEIPPVPRGDIFLVGLKQLSTVFSVAPAKEQWASSLCHSLVPHTIGELCLHYIKYYLSQLKVLTKTIHLLK